jgi:tetratricopeptide (TPR) repeat protein
MNGHNGWRGERQVIRGFKRYIAVRRAGSTLSSPPWRTRLCAMLLLIGLSPAPAAAQRLSLPAGALDSASLQNPLQMIDFVFADDRPKALALFDELLTRAPDIQPAMVAQIRYLRAVAASEQDAIARTYRELMLVRGGEFVFAYPRILLSVGEYTEALRLAKAWTPAPGAPARPIAEEVESVIARLRGESQRALNAAQAMRRAPGQSRSHVAIGLELGALAHVTPASRPSVALTALVDTALSITPRGFRVDPVAVYVGYGDALRDAGHDALAQRAWTRALTLLDSTASRVNDRGDLARDSVRVSRGRLLYALGRYADARAQLQAPSGRRDNREQFRKGWLAVTSWRLGDKDAARRIDRELAADTSHALRGATAVARATIAEAMGDPRRGADLLFPERNAIDIRTMLGQWQLSRTLRDPRLVAWRRGR